MLTRFITEVTTKFNPFSAGAKPARLFLSNLPPRARLDGMIVNTQLLARTSTEPSSIYVKFSDGKEMNIDCETATIKGIVEEVDRHSRMLQKQASLEA